MKGWEVVADNLKKAGLSSGWVSALDLEGRTIWIADAHRAATGQAPPDAQLSAPALHLPTRPSVKITKM
jgi:hypothetical protein